MTEGKSSRLFSECRKLLWTEPSGSHRILSVLAHMTAHYLIKQVQVASMSGRGFSQRVHCAPSARPLCLPPCQPLYQPGKVAWAGGWANRPQSPPWTLHPPPLERNTAPSTETRGPLILDSLCALIAPAENIEERLFAGDHALQSQL